MQRSWACFKHVMRHKWCVLIECTKRGQFWRGLMHDMSKFLPDEWIHYCKYFYNADGSEKAPDQKRYFSERHWFDWAFWRHIKRNPHHWQHWVLMKDDGTMHPQEMPMQYVIEMYCDWIGAGKAIHGDKADLPKWYASTKQGRRLAFGVRTQIEFMMRSDYGRIE